jgi:ribosomal-protein-alanine N-acetyltransferase
MTHRLGWPNRHVEYPLLPWGTTMAAGSELLLETLRADTRDLTDLQAIADESFTPSTRIDLCEELGRAFSRGWVARSADGSGRPLGVLITWVVADELHVLNVATRRSARRQGVGLALMNAALVMAREHHLRTILLEVRASNQPAIALYRRLGFFVANIRKGYYSDNAEDALDMLLELHGTTGEVVRHPDEAG